MKAAVVLMPLLAACAPSRLHADPPEAEWVLVQTSPGAAVVRRLEPDPVVHARLLRETANVGDVAEMELTADREATVRLLPSRPGIRILGRDVVEVGPRPVTVRFTADSPGRGTLLARTVGDPP